MLDAACSRLVTTADLDIKGTPRILNMQLVKALTGNDISDAGVRVLDHQNYHRRLF